MGRQANSRQARRQQQRRQQQRAGAHNPGGPRPSGGPAGRTWTIIAGVLVVLIALALFGYFALGSRNSSTGAIATPTVTFTNGPTINGIGCDQGMSAGNYSHIHAHVEILNKGVPETISPDYGHYYNKDCLYWMHAHQDVNGIVHMESPHPIHPTLATWLKVAQTTLPKSEWPSLTPPAGEQEKAWVNEKPYHGNPLQIRLYKHTDVTVEFGPPFSTPKPFVYPSGL